MILICMTFQIYLPFCLTVVFPDALARPCLHQSLYTPVLLNDTCRQTDPLLPSR